MGTNQAIKKNAREYFYNACHSSIVYFDKTCHGMKFHHCALAVTTVNVKTAMQLCWP